MTAAESDSTSLLPEPSGFGATAASVVPPFTKKRHPDTSLELLSDTTSELVSNKTSELASDTTSELPSTPKAQSIQSDVKHNTPNRPTVAESACVRPTKRLRKDPVLDEPKLLWQRPLYVPTVYNEFDNVQPIGRGSFSVVHSATLKHNPTDMDPRRALKCHVSGIKSPSDITSRMREVRMAERAGDHPNLLKYYRAWYETQRQLVMEMELLGPALDGIVANHIRLCSSKPKLSLSPDAGLASNDTKVAKIPTMNPCECQVRLLVNVVRDVGSALHHLHSHGIVHLDVKPENILQDTQRIVARDGVSPCECGNGMADYHWKLGDMGHARLLPPRSGPTSTADGCLPLYGCQTQTPVATTSTALSPKENDGTIVDGDYVRNDDEGDKRFMAPEFFVENIELTPSVDIYSLGMSLSALLADMYGEHGCFGPTTQQSDLADLAAHRLPSNKALNSMINDAKTPIVDALRALVQLMTSPLTAHRPSAGALVSFRRFPQSTSHPPAVATATPVPLVS